jgi:hypothetical protein
MDMQESIVANAELVRQMARKLGVEVGFDEAGVHWLGGFIDRQRSVATDAQKADALDTLGSFLGECIRRTYGGEWQENEHGLLVKINERVSVYPFNKVQKHLKNEDGDSVLGLFNSIPAMLTVPARRVVTVRPSEENKRPWWRFW